MDEYLHVSQRAQELMLRSVDLLDDPEILEMLINSTSEQHVLSRSSIDRIHRELTFKQA